MKNQPIIFFPKGPDKIQKNLEMEDMCHTCDSDALKKSVKP